MKPTKKMSAMPGLRKPAKAPKTKASVTTALLKAASKKKAY